MGIPERLKSQTSEMAQIFVSRIFNLREREDLAPCFKSVLFQPRTPALPIECGDYYAVGIDGSMEYDELFEMMLFYICATGFKCPFTIKDRIHFHLNCVERDSRLEASASIPMWMEDISSVTGETGSTEKELVWSAERVPFAVMTMAELYLALKATEDPRVRVVFLDRPIYGTFSPLARDLRKILGNKKSALLKINTAYGRPTLLDLSLVRVLGSGHGIVPSRRNYFPYLIIKYLLERGEATRGEVLRDLGLKDQDWGVAAKGINWLIEKTGVSFLEDDLERLTLKDEIKEYWLRMKELALKVVEHIFSSSEHPLIFRESEEWLTVWDLNVINLILIQMLRERSNHVLFIGIAKDTTASDFISGVLSYAVFSRLIKVSRPIPAIRHDRAFLTILSGANPNICSPPWRTISYDACFTTLIGLDTMRAARRSVFMEGQFVKAYFQLREFQGDREVRSPTFLYDRFFNPKYDSPFLRELEVMMGEDKIRVKAYWEGEGENALDDFILSLLSASDNPEVLEVMGHNQLLYLADKAVKADIKMMKDLLRSVAELELGPISRKYKLFTIARRFRDIRAEMERLRSRHGGE
ncbi:MAG: hypothetical protein ACUVQ5_05865 [Candidatus Methanomethylicaceae archaeon]